MEKIGELTIINQDALSQPRGDDPKERGWGLVMVTTGRYKGKVGLYDDDDWDCRFVKDECRDDEFMNCETCGKGRDRAVVYLGSILEWPVSIRHDYLRTPTVDEVLEYTRNVDLYPKEKENETTHA